MNRPSGETAGLVSLNSVLRKGRGALPASCTQTSSPPAVSSTNASRRPSADQEGASRESSDGATGSTGPVPSHGFDATDRALSFWTAKLIRSGPGPQAG